MCVRGNAEAENVLGNGVRTRIPSLVQRATNGWNFASVVGVPVLGRFPAHSLFPFLFVVPVHDTWSGGSRMIVTHNTQNTRTAPCRLSSSNKFDQSDCIPSPLKLHTESTNWVRRLFLFYFLVHPTLLLFRRFARHIFYYYYYATFRMSMVDHAPVMPTRKMSTFVSISFHHFIFPPSTRNRSVGWFIFKTFWCFGKTTKLLIRMKWLL